MAPKNLMSNKFSQTPRPDQNVKQICLYKLTGGYRKRSSGSRAMKQNEVFSPEISVNIFSASTTRPRRDLLGRKGGTVSTSHIRSKIPGRRRKALKFASASEFAHFLAREGPPASIFHENFENSDFMTDLGPKKSGVKQIFTDTAPRPKC